MAAAARDARVVRPRARAGGAEPAALSRGAHRSGRRSGRALPPGGGG